MSSSAAAVGRAVRVPGRPRVKICGVTTVEDALTSCALGADLLGLNFYPPSPRCLDLETAGRIAAAVRREHPEVLLVAVVVDLGDEELRRIEREVGVDLVQFHGDEPAAQVAAWAPRAIRALRLGAGATRAELAAWSHCWGVLIDAPHAVLRGGTGETWDFGAVRTLAGEARLLLAGGLRPDNVAAAVAAVPGAWAIDLCSGVEASPGRKDPDRLAALFDALSPAYSGRTA
ncbi:MAG: phosphoribosylanthranilate isomerase [Acidobacteria bacterium]|nr:MAG: phosphoribosylanthranilate isomerase [Acidobacteriota bacterium]